MTLPAQKQKATDDLLGAYDAPTSASRWANEAREAALGRYQNMGAPTRRDEYWKYTNPAALTAGIATENPVAPTDVTAFDQVDSLKLVFVDGRFDVHRSDAIQGVQINQLADVLAADIHACKDLFGELEARGQKPVHRPLAALNTAMAKEGVVIHVKGQLDRPVEIQYLREDPTADILIHNVIKLDKDASLTLLESGAIGARFNIVSEIDVPDNASFHHIRLQGRETQRAGSNHIFARLGAESLFKSFTLAVNGTLTRNETIIELTGDNANAHVACAAAGDGDFHHDDTVFVTHDAVNCESRQVFKKVLRNGATSCFQGKILVKPDAQKTDGYQISQGLLLDDDSNFLAKPELEIYADDVACSHGSTCGGADETALFYLMSRGISRDQAQDMLVLAFLDEAIQEIADETLADAIRGQLQAWLR